MEPISFSGIRTYVVVRTGVNNQPLSSTLLSNIAWYPSHFLDRFLLYPWQRPSFNEITSTMMHKVGGGGKGYVWWMKYWRTERVGLKVEVGSAVKISVDAHFEVLLYT